MLEGAVGVDEKDSGWVDVEVEVVGWAGVDTDDREDAGGLSGGFL